MNLAALGLTLSIFLAGCGGKGPARIRDAAADSAVVVVADANLNPAGRDAAPESANGDADNELDLAGAADTQSPSDAGGAMPDVSLDNESGDVSDAILGADGPSRVDAPERDDLPSLPADVIGDDADLAPPATPECFDNNPCTTDVFDGQACRHSPVSDGTACTDGNACTLGDSCQAGLCVAGTAQQGSLTELGRVDAFGIEAGTVIPIGDDRLLFVDPAYPYTVLHTVASVDDTLSVLGAEHPRPDQPFAYLPGGSTSTIANGWSGHAAFGWNSSYEVNLVTVDTNGVPTLHPSFELPLASGFLAGHLNGLTGHDDTLWACANYSFFGPASGTLFRYDIANPDAPELVQSVGLPVACGSTTLTDDGKRVYVNTSDGIYWLDLAGTDGGDTVAVDGPFGVNSGLAVVGSILLSRSSTSGVVLYDLADHSELLRIEQDGLIGSAYLPAQQVLVLARQVKTDSGYERWLQVNDARAGGAGALLDEVLLDTSGITSTWIASAGEVVVDSYSKAAFRVSEGRLVRLSLPALGGFGTLADGPGALGVWSATSWRALDISDPPHPALLSPGGLIPGHHRGLGLDIGSRPPVLLDDLGYAGDSALPRLGRVRTSSSYPHDGDALLVALRDSDAWAEGTGVGSVLLPGVQTSTLQWSSESLFRIDNPSAGQFRLQRWDQAQLLSSSATVPREDRTFTLAGMPDTAKSATSVLDFPEQGNLGLVAVGYSLSLDGGTSYNAILTWLDRSTPTTSLVEQVPVEGLRSSLRDCRVAQNRAVCLTAGQMILVERDTQPGGVVVHFASIDSSYTGLLAFDGHAIFLSRREALEVVSFATLFEWDATSGDASADGGATSDAGLPDAVRVPFSSYPLSMIETEDALVVSSLYEVVTLQPHCLDRP